eukprot:4879161-Ditylum_brightwellii.AAC.1
MFIRPIDSYSGSLLHPLGIWVDDKLKIIAQDIPTYIKDSKSLKDDFLNITLLPGCKIVTADAKSMYINIKTAPALNKIR